MDDDDAVVAGARAIRPYLGRLAGSSAVAAELDRHLADALNGSSGRQEPPASSGTCPTARKTPHGSWPKSWPTYRTVGRPGPGLRCPPHPADRPRPGMLTTFWQTVGGRLADRWASVSIPALIFWLSGLAAWTRHRGGLHALTTQTDWLDRQSTAVQVTVSGPAA